MLQRFSKKEREYFYQEIRKHGFIKDELVGKDIDRDVYGVNIACAWPLPAEIRELYEALYKKLNRLEGVYVYPYAQTHITVLTVINFKKRLNGMKEHLDAMTLKALKAKIESTLQQKSIKILIDSPVLLQSAAFLPIYNPGGEIYEIRKAALSVLNGGNRSYDLDVPKAIHSTILRFKDVPENSEEILLKFEEIMKDFHILEGTIRELYVTEELKPYMKEGRILEKIKCK
jgi:hypothetical protein